MIKSFGIFILCIFVACNVFLTPIIPTYIVADESEIIDLKPHIVPKIILITIDGVRWQDIFNGTDPLLWKNQSISSRELLPYIYSHFVDHGMAIGKNSDFIASGPNHISLPGYLEIMRGHPSVDCQTNECEPKLDTTIADYFENVAVFTSWETIHKAISANITDKMIINCGRSYRSAAWKRLHLTEGPEFKDYFDHEYRPDNLTILATMKYLQDNVPDFTYIGLGDSDEFAHANNYKEYINSLKQADTFIGSLLYLIRTFNWKNYTILITADHGRGAGWTYHGYEKESEKDWLLMYGANIPEKGFVSYKETKSLSNIFPTITGIISSDHSEKSLLFGQ